MTDQDRMGPPPVEPLSDVAWARVERGLWARLDEVAPVAPVVRSRRWWWVAAPALAAAAVVAVVIATRGGDAPIRAADPARLVSGTSPSSLTFGDAHVTLDADSAIVMSRDTAAPSAVLERGAAWFSIAPRAGRPPFVVVAGDTVVRVIGTRFRVARSAERAVVEVEHGLVDVQFRGTKVGVGAGQRWSSERPAEVDATRTAQVAAPAQPPHIDIDTPAPQAPNDRIVRTVKPKRPPEHTPATVAGQPEAAPAPTEVAKSVDDDRTKFEQASALEARAPQAALASYLELADGHGRWAALSLFAAGRLAADRKDPRATGLLETYLQRFPRGANADDARELIAHLKGDHR